MPKEEKRKREELAFQYVIGLVQPCSAMYAQRIKDAWLDYEYGRTPEGKWMKEMDKFECLTQAHEYEQKTHGKENLEEFQSYRSKINSAVGNSWLRLLDTERATHRVKRQRRLPVTFITGDQMMYKPHCASLAQELDFQYIAIDDLVRAKSRDCSYQHAKFVGTYVDEDLELPVGLITELVEKSIEEGIRDGKRWSVVHGFPVNMDQLLEFEQQVQESNYIIFLEEAPQYPFVSASNQWRSADLQEILEMYDNHAFRSDKVRRHDALLDEVVKLFDEGVGKRLKAGETYSTRCEEDADKLRLAMRDKVNEVRSCLDSEEQQEAPSPPDLFKKINSKQDEAALYGSIKNALEGFTRHAEGDTKRLPLH
ncbi:MAG: HD domain-containing protein 2 [Bathelium mastoideum]|nr:MAG: HD domain-containing protein 2 [Bathelium mastoideum]